MIERKFIEDRIKALEIEEYLSDALAKAEYSHTNIQITPLSTRLVIHVGRPGVAIGRAGKNIEKITKYLSEKFGVKNPQLDIQSLQNPNLDASYVAYKISSAIEQYVKPNKMVNIYLRNIMSAGAYGAEIRISGKISGGRGRADKKQVGYIKKSGDFAIYNVDIGTSTAKLKPGILGIKVMIMKALPESMILESKIKNLGVVKSEELEKKKIDDAVKEERADKVEVKEAENEKIEATDAEKKKTEMKKDKAEKKEDGKRNGGKAEDEKKEVKETESVKAEAEAKTEAKTKTETKSSVSDSKETKDTKKGVLKLKDKKTDKADAEKLDAKKSGSAKKSSEDAAVKDKVPVSDKGEDKDKDKDKSKDKNKDTGNDKGKDKSKKGTKTDAKNKKEDNV